MHTSPCNVVRVANSLTLGGEAGSLPAQLLLVENFPVSCSSLQSSHLYKALCPASSESLSSTAHKEEQKHFGSTTRPAQIAELPRSKLDPELFPHSAYVEIFVTFATKVAYLTFCNKM